MRVWCDRSSCVSSCLPCLTHCPAAASAAAAGGRLASNGTPDVQLVRDTPESQTRIKRMKTSGV
jgi:hypothetical protein